MPQVACPDRESLGQLLLGNLSTERAELLEEHLLHCDRCSQLAETIPAADEVTAAFASSETIPVDEQLSLAIDRAKRLPANADTSESIETILRSTQDDAPAASQAFDPREIDFLGPRERPDDIGCLGGYRVLQVLGVGGMGVVFRAEDPQLKRQVALKAMKPVIAASLSAKDRFLKEAAATAAIEHDHIVTIYQVGEDRGIPFIAMQYLRGESLQTRLDREHLLHQREVVRIGRQIASGLAAAHEHDLIHRDVKPDNIWLESQQGRVKILDFGLVRSTHEETGLTRSGVVLGTPRYMSPEQAQGGNGRPPLRPVQPGERSVSPRQRSRTVPRAKRNRDADGSGAGRSLADRRRLPQSPSGNGPADHAAAVERPESAAAVGAGCRAAPLRR